MEGITTELFQGGETLVKAMHAFVTKIQQEEDTPDVMVTQVDLYPLSTNTE